MKEPAASCVSRSAAFWRGMVVAFLVSVPLTELAAQQVVRGPYLQRGAPSSMVVRWRTDKPISLALAKKWTFPLAKQRECVVLPRFPSRMVKPGTRYSSSLSTSAGT